MSGGSPNSREVEDCVHRTARSGLDIVAHKLCFENGWAIWNYWVQSKRGYCGHKWEQVDSGWLGFPGLNTGSVERS